jgi:hypothetical protein
LAAVAGAVAIEFLAHEPSPRGDAAVYRALRDDAPFAFVVVGGGTTYEVVHEDGVPDGAEGVVLIDRFDVPADAEAGFLADWHAAREQTATHLGYQGARLYRATGPARVRFVAFARWSSPLAFARAAGGPAVAGPVMYLLVAG